ncbi:uncharacterized protein J3D65DRAFT_608183 [Phyllosticta citribraziliensis]|uniref:Uncharacterized protein n=1 Tax=Phyllosticta citribraziliensis TaxID=989973 RepID=A0ABR1MB00_9PEZI
MIAVVVVVVVVVVGGRRRRRGHLLEIRSFFSLIIPDGTTGDGCAAGGGSLLVWVEQRESFDAATSTRYGEALVALCWNVDTFFVATASESSRTMILSAAEGGVGGGGRGGGGGRWPICWVRLHMAWLGMDGRTEASDWKSGRCGSALPTRRLDCLCEQRVPLTHPSPPPAQRDRPTSVSSDKNIIRFGSVRFTTWIMAVDCKQRQRHCYNAGAGRNRRQR